jgi:uncharacterized protein with HEPN domain
MPRSDREYLRDIVEAAEAIARYLAGRRRAEFLADEILARAVLQRLTEIGEAASRLSSDVRGRHPSVDWRRVAAFRNFAVHAYFALDWEIVWVAATVDAPHLAAQIAGILAQDDPTKDRPEGTPR